jgi:hypothetical protein
VIDPLHPEFFILRPSGKFACQEYFSGIWGPFPENPFVINMMQSIIMMAEGKISKLLVPRKLFFLPETFPDTLVNDGDEWLQPGVGEIET